MQSESFELSQLEEFDSFVLCDLAGPGSPVRYASKGFQELYGYSMTECVGQSCSDLLGGSRVLQTGRRALAEVAASAGLSGDEASRSVQLLTSRLQQRATQATPDTEADPLLSIDCRKTGELFTASVRVLHNVHPVLGWSYKASLQQDVTDDVSVAALLRAALEGEVELLLLEAQLGQARPELAPPALLSARSLEYLHGVAGVLWRQSLANAALDMGQRKKPRLSDDKSEDGRSLASVSTACSLSQVPVKPRKCNKLGQVKPIRTAHHLGALVAPCGSAAATTTLEPTTAELAGATRFEAEEEACMLNEFVEKQETRNSSPDSTRPEVRRQELYEFGFPFVIADPTWPQCPIVLCSQGFSKFSARSTEEVLGTELMSLGGAGGLGPEVSLAVEYLLRAAHEGKFLSEGLSCVDGAERVPAGEVQFGIAGGAVILKQVLLDDCMFVIGVMDKDEDEMDVLPRLTAWLDTAVTTLAAEFFYSAPIRRQVAEGTDGVDMTEF
mmetsp:Transcript_19876/g.46502  ORF Transcript_19876/g.46502 Transcript_19876/m.46502 type:complete len:499 (-) Transcript_19876:30-1526(-)